MAEGQDEEGWDFIPTDEEREAAKTNKHSEFGTLFFEREQLERDELAAKLTTINEAGLDAQIE